MSLETSLGQPAETGNRLYFGVDARHVRQLGRELVGDRVTALVELVKNAYDADASDVALEFTTGPVFIEDPGQADQPEGAGHMRVGSLVDSQLVVRDDGAGMSLQDLRDGWMRIAGDNKERNPRSPRYGRTRAGRKGIGRFAAESLGERLTLWTTQEGSNVAVEVMFRWTIDYDAGLDLQSVGNEYQLLETDPASHGTTLTIRGLNGAWTKAQRSKVGRALLAFAASFSRRCSCCKTRAR